MIHDPLFWKALLAGLGVAVLAAPFGCLVVWRRMAYLGDGLAHCALLGGALAALIDVAPFVGVLMIGLIAAVLLSRQNQRGPVGPDSLLAVLAHGSFAAGLVLAMSLPNGSAALMSWLLGDILATSWEDALVIWACCLGTFAVLIPLWRPLLALTVDENLAQAEGHPIARLRLIQMVLMVLAVTVGIKAVGVLLLTALLVTPAAAARRFARTPEQMVLLTAVLGGLSTVGGLVFSWLHDTPTGPAIVLIAVALFALSYAVPARS